MQRMPQTASSVDISGFDTLLLRSGRLGDGGHIRHAEYSVEVGTTPDMNALRTRWLSLKAGFGPLLAGLSPGAVKDKRPGSTQSRLMAGPLRSVAAARELCAKFVAT